MPQNKSKIMYRKPPAYGFMKAQRIRWLEDIGRGA